jgi:hypothetical protein
MLNRAWAAVASSGVASNDLVALEVTERKSGRTISLLLVVAVVDGQRIVDLEQHMKKAIYSPSPLQNGSF